MSDSVKHPSHYTEGRKFEPKDVIRDWGLNFNLGSAVKYVARAGRKDDIVQDLKKAQQFIQFEIDAIEEERERCKVKEAERIKKYPKHISKMDTVLDPITRALARAKACTVTPIIVELPEGVDAEAFIKKIWGGK